MNFTKTALVLAMAGIVSVPMAVQAGESGFYGSIRQAIVHKSNDLAGSDSTIDFANRGSRMGFAGEKDLGNGMTSFGKFEFGVNTDGSNAATVTRRKAYVGIKGDFGSVLMGQTYHTYYSHVNGPVDIANWNSGFQSQGRTDNALTYSGAAGALTFGATIYADSSDPVNGVAATTTTATKIGTAEVAASGDTGIDGTEFAATFDAGMFKVGAGIKSSSNKVGTDPEDIVGFAVSGNIGPAYVAVALNSQDKAYDATEVSVSMGQGYVIYHVQDNEGTADGDQPTDLTLGYSLPIGPSTNAWLEYTTHDSDKAVANAGDTDQIEAVIKFGW